MLSGTVMQHRFIFFHKCDIFRVFHQKTLLLGFLLNCDVAFFFPLFFSVSTCSSYLNTQVKKSLRTGFLWHCTVEAMVIQWHNEG